MEVVEVAVGSLLRYMIPTPHIEALLQRNLTL
jgi:hypothetical protein